MRAGAVVQARMGSTRLPGKVLRPIAGRPLLARAVERLRLATTLDLVAVATTTDPGDDAVAAWCDAAGVPCHRGPVDDVLQRYLDAARRWSLDVVLRITGDCPFLCPDVVDAAVRVMRATGADCATGDRPSIHEGIDPWRVATLAALAPTVTDPAEREHLALLARHRLGTLRVAEIPIPARDAARPGLRLSVDDPADLAFADTLAGALDALPRPFRTTDLLAALDARPDLVDLNRHVPRAVPSGIR